MYALDGVPGSVFGALHNSMQGWQAKARMHKFAIDGAKPYVMHAWVWVLPLPKQRVRTDRP